MAEETLFNNPNTLYEQQLRDIFKAKPEAQKDPLFQLLNIVFQSSANIKDVGDIYRLLGFENFIRFTHLVSGRTIKFPSSLDLKEAIILTLCYYYRKIQRKEWAEIHEILPFEFNSIAISRRIKNLDDEFAKKINFGEEKTMADMEKEARDIAAGLEDKTLKSDAVRVANTDPLDDLKQNLVQFFKDRVAGIKRSDQLRESLYQRLLEQLEEGQLEFEQLMQLYRTLGNENNTAAADILNIFKPAPNTPSLFLEVSKPADKDDEIKKAYKNFESKDLQIIERLLGLVDQLGKKSQNATVAEAEVVEKTE